MKLTQTLLHQHLGRQLKNHWRVQGKRVPLETRAEKILVKEGIPVYQPKDILQEKKQLELQEIVEDRTPRFDETHPNWHERVCYTYKDGNVLLEGLKQAKILTKTIETINGLPKKMEVKQLAKGIDGKVKEIILNSHLFDAEQQKLPKVKDPLRPAWNFPRSYGVTDCRINKLITSKLLQLIESYSPESVVEQRLILNDMHFSFPMEKNGDLVQFELRSDTLLTSSRPLQALTDEDTTLINLPDIFPIKETVTLNPDNIYEIRNIYPINPAIPKHHPHTIFVHYNSTEVKNLYEEVVTDEQILGRSLLKTFTVAASYAKQLYGDSIKTLPSPVAVQCVQTDGRLFHFGVLQVNTLDFDGVTGVKNVWYHKPQIPLFDSCSYVSGKPTLTGYNSEVTKLLFALYHNI